MVEEKKEAKPEGKIKIKLPKLNVWILISLILAIALVLSLVQGWSITGQMVGVISSEEAGEKTIDYINSNLVEAGSSATFVSTEDVGSMYKVTFSYQDRQYVFYVTKDGTYLSQNVWNINEAIEREQPEQSQEVPKTDKPEVELFVMSHCPYGVKAQEILIPVMKLLGDKADIETRFVYYTMHGKIEIDDNTIEYCIQKEQENKFVDYLTCFVSSENSSECIKSANIDTTNLNSCISRTDSQFKITELFNNQSTWLNGIYPLYPIDKELCEQYDVGGSESLIINGVSISPSQYRWSPENLKTIICNAFNEIPEECSQTLSTGETSTTSGGCG